GLGGVDPAFGQGSIVAGVSGIVSGGAAGPIFCETADWSGVVGGDADASFPSLFVASRSFGAGRVLAIGHESLLTNVGALDNGVFLANALSWLAAGGTQIRAASGHGEFAAGSGLNALASIASGQGMSLQSLPGTLSTSALTGVSVLIVGNAWGNFTPTEITAVQQWVGGGGGLLVAGLGWSWLAYHPGMTLEDYPMAKLSAPYGVRWLSSVISDPTNNVSGSPVFSVFFPAVEVSSVAASLTTIQAAHTTHGATLAAQLESNATLRQSFTRAHQTLALVATDFALTDPVRVDLYDGLTSLVTQWGSFYARGFSFSPSATPTAATLRERMWRSWRDALPLTPARIAQISTLGQLTGQRLDLFEEYGLLLLDNDFLDAAQIALIAQMRAGIPVGLGPLHGISVRDYLGMPPVSIDLGGAEHGVNIFGFDIGQVSENPFPVDVPPYVADTYSSALAHELNHIVDAVVVVEAGGDLLARRDQLIADAGTDALNYLRSVIPDGFFVNAPQEFFASISNQYINDSERTLDLGLVRLLNGRPDPINQFLFFCDVYSNGTDTSYFYQTTSQGVFSRTTVTLARNASGRINHISVGNRHIDFTLSAEGRVIAFTESFGTPFVRGDCNGSGGVDIADAVFLLAALFSGGATPSCDDACDTGDDGTVDIADAVSLLGALFGGAAPPPAPHPTCGLDPTADSLGCGAFAGCP
ncbi:MAG: dockerin type I repeat-containing protein, partial [Planctomycetota bacterium]